MLRWSAALLVVLMRSVDVVAAAPGVQSSTLQAPQVGTTYSLVAPKSAQFDLQISGLFGFTGPGSIVRVREFHTEGTGLHFSSMDMNTEQMPTIDALDTDGGSGIADDGQLHAHGLEHLALQARPVPDRAHIDRGGADGLPEVGQVRVDTALTPRTTVVGVPAPSTWWDFAAGSTSSTTDEYLSLLNPSTASVTVNPPLGAQEETLAAGVSPEPAAGHYSRGD